MEHLTPAYLSRAEAWLFLTILLYFFMNRAQVFETLVFVPKWVASPPESFDLLIDGKGTSLKIFWIVVHSLHELVFIIAIVFCWKIDPVRNWLLVLFGVHMALRAWTLMFFAPNIIEFQKIAEGASFGDELNARAEFWQKLNYLRVLLFIGVSIGLLPLFMKLFSLRH